MSALVSVQKGRKRWAYVIEESGSPLYVSRYQYGSAEAARKAGEHDARHAIYNDVLRGKRT